MKKIIGFALVMVAIISAATWYGIRTREPIYDQSPLASEEPLEVESAAADEPAPVSEQERSIRDESARVLAAEFEAFLVDWKVSKMTRSNDPATERALVFARKLKSFDPIQQEIFTSQILQEIDRSQEGFFDQLALYVSAVSMCQPKAGVLLLKKPPEEFKNPGKSAEIAELRSGYETALITLATREPVAALQWVIENKIQFSEFVGENTKRWMIISAGKANPEFGIRIAYEWFGEVPSHPMILIAMSATTQKQRASILNVAKECSEVNYPGKSDEHPLDELVGLLANGVVAEGFDSAMRWIGNTRLSPSEIDSFSSGLASAKPEDALKWIDWIAKKVSPRRAESGMYRVVANWTTANPQAVAKWLESYREGNLRNWAISAYVWKVVERDHNSAAIWAAKLPQGDLRNDSMGIVYRNWPKNDPKGAADFAIQQQIKK